MKQQPFSIYCEKFRLDAKWQWGRSVTDWRRVAMCRNHAIGGIQGERLGSRWKHGEYKGRVGNALHRGGLHKRSVYRWHGLAAILRVMAVRRARHRIAALHSLFWRDRRTAVKRVRCKSDCDHHQKEWPG